VFCVGGFYSECGVDRSSDQGFAEREPGTGLELGEFDFFRLGEVEEVLCLRLDFLLLEEDVAVDVPEQIPAFIRTG
jgi:hypothetical protein